MNRPISSPVNGRRTGRYTRPARSFTRPRASRMVRTTPAPRSSASRSSTGLSPWRDRKGGPILPESAPAVAARVTRLCSFCRSHTGARLVPQPKTPAWWGEEEVKRAAGIVAVYDDCDGDGSTAQFDRASSTLLDLLPETARLSWRHEADEFLPTP